MKTQRTIFPVLVKDLKVVFLPTPCVMESSIARVGLMRTHQHAPTGRVEEDIPSVLIIFNVSRTKTSVSRQDGNFTTGG